MASLAGQSNQRGLWLSLSWSIHEKSPYLGLS